MPPPHTTGEPHPIPRWRRLFLSQSLMHGCVHCMCNALSHTIFRFALWIVLVFFSCCQCVSLLSFLFLFLYRFILNCFSSIGHDSDEFWKIGSRLGREPIATAKKLWTKRWAIVERNIIQIVRRCKIPSNNGIGLDKCGLDIATHRQNIVISHAERENRHFKHCNHRNRIRVNSVRCMRAALKRHLCHCHSPNAVRISAPNLSIRHTVLYPNWSWAPGHASCYPSIYLQYTGLVDNIQAFIESKHS